MRLLRTDQRINLSLFLKEFYFFFLLDFKAVFHKYELS